MRRLSAAEITRLDKLLKQAAPLYKRAYEEFHNDEWDRGDFDKRQKKICKIFQFAYDKLNTNWY